MINETCQAINDAIPTIEPATVFIELPEQIDLETVIHTVSASDSDVVVNLMYTIQNRSNYSYFSVDSMSGNITATKKLPTGNLTISVVANDGTYTSNSQDVTFGVFTVPTPNINVSSANITIKETAQVNSTILVIRCTAEDTLDSNLVATINDESGNFKLNGQDLVLLISLDGSHDPEYHLTVNCINMEYQTAYDVVTSDSLNITIFVEEVPKEWIQFSEEEYSINITENSKLGLVVPLPLDVFLYTRISSNTENGTRLNRTHVNVTVTGGGEFVQFDKDTWNLTVLRLIDRERQPVIQLAALAEISGSTTRSNITINVLDRNDNPPTFQSNVFHGIATDLSGLSSTILLVNASDPDANMNGFIHFSLDNTTLFSIDNTSGRVYPAVAPLPLGHYLLIVTATDGGNPTMSSTALVVITVNEDPSKTATFPKSSFQFTVDENATIGSFVGSVGRMLPDYVQEEPMYTILSQIPSNYFIIDGATGEISTLRYLDNNNVPRMFHIRVQVEAGQHNQTADVYINITDVNNNAPQFLQSHYVFELTCSSTVDSSSNNFNVSAIDRDHGINEHIIYSLSGSGNFTINTTNGIISPTTCPSEGRYVLIVTARDAGTPVQSTDVRVDILVSPAIPNMLIFDDNSRNFSVAENSPIGTSIGSIKTSNVPHSLLNLLRYSLIEGNYSDSFLIGENSGELIALNSFDREQKDVYQLVVSVDLSEEVNATVAVQVFILDINDHDPIFGEDIYVASFSARVPLAPESLQVTTTDNDLVSDVTYSIEASPPVSFRISDKGLITATRPLLPGVISFLVVASNRQDGILRTNQVTVIINAIFEPDELTCERNTFAFTVSERMSGGHYVGNITVSASNAALIDEGALSFTDDSDVFAVNNNGILYTTDSLDYESTQRVYSFVVTATSLISNSSTVTVNCSVVVTIEDDNDNGPNITNLPQTISIREDNISISVPIFYLNVYDPDEQASFTYSILNGNFPFLFSPNMPNGILYLGADRDEGYTSFDLVIAVNDSEHIDTGVLTVNILDANDNSPQLIAPLYYSIQERCCANQTIFNIITNDKDEGANAVVSSRLGNYNDVFELQGNALVLLHELDFELQENYEVLIEMTDNGLPSQTNTGTITIHVADQPDTPPTFINGAGMNVSEYPVRIAPNISSGSEIISIMARDPDQDRVEFEIIDVTGTPEGMFTFSDFSIGNVSGVIYKRREEKFTADQNVTLTVRATDDSEYHVTSTVKVVIKIVPRSLTFVQSTHNFNITENTKIHGVTCTNDYLLEILEVSRARDITFRIEGINPNVADGDVMLDIVRDSNSDLVVGAKVCLASSSITLDREEFSSVQLNVSAESATGTAFTSAEIAVVDVNDNFPSIVPNVSMITIQENNSPNIPIAFVNVSDADIGPNAVVTLAIFGSSIVLLQHTTIILGMSLNFEMEDHYEFTVTATDQGTPPQSSTQAFRIEVSDVNDPPILDSDSYIAFAKASTTKGDGVNTVILTAGYSDEDNGDSISRIITPPFLDGREDNMEIQISIGINFEAGVTTGSFMMETFNIIDLKSGMDSANLYLVIFPTDALFQLKIPSKLSVRAFLRSREAVEVKEALENAAAGLQFHFYNGEDIDQDNLLISGVFYQGNGEPPGRVTGTPVYDYIFENSNSSSTIIMNRLDTINALLQFRIALGNSTPTDAPTQPPDTTQAPADNFQLIITIIIAVVLVVVIMGCGIVVLLFVCRRRKKPKEEGNQAENDNWGMRRKPIGQDTIPLQPRNYSDINKLLHEDDELLGQNVQMPWWDPNYVKDENENATTLRATVDGDRRKTQMSRTPSEDANSDMDNYLSSYKADASTTVTTLESPRPSELDLFVQGKGNFTTPSRPAVSNVKWS